MLRRGSLAIFQGLTLTYCKFDWKFHHLENMFFQVYFQNFLKKWECIYIRCSRLAPRSPGNSSIHGNNSRTKKIFQKHSNCEREKPDRKWPRLAPKSPENFPEAFQKHSNCEREKTRQKMAIFL
jgi:hypothetical protein